MVDIDEATLVMYKNRAAPLIIDHVIHRENPLRIEVLKGSISVSSEYLKNTDAVIAIELIEHLYPDVLEEVPYNIFGFIQPKIALFSTPNYEFNVLFKPLPNGFRHHDHKFEWTREQFQDWAHNICERFPNYRVTFFGVGEAPNNPDIGPVSQFALFVRRDVHDLPLVSEIEDVPTDTNPEPAYEVIYEVDFPMRRDERTLEQKIWDETNYFLNYNSQMEVFHNTERRVYEVPLDKILETLEPITTSMVDLRRVLLENNQILEDNFLIVPEYDSASDTESNYERDNNDLNSSNGHYHDNDRDNGIESPVEELWD